MKPQPHAQILGPFVLLILVCLSGCATSGGAKIDAKAKLGGKEYRTGAGLNIGAEAGANEISGKEACETPCQCNQENCDGQNSCGGDCCDDCSCAVTVGVSGSCSCSIKAKPTDK